MESNAGACLLNALDNLSPEDFKRFKHTLRDMDFEERPTIPWGRLENADPLDTKDLLIDSYTIDKAIDATIEAFTRTSLMEAAANLREATGRGSIKLQKLCSSEVEENKKKYKEYIKKIFREMKDANSFPGEHVTLKERYTKLLILKNFGLKEEKKHEIMWSGKRHLKLMDQRAQHSYSSIEALFDPEEDGHIPSTIVLQGAAGIGKTVTARKIMFDWASGELFKDRFEYVVYIQCRELNLVSGEKTIADLIEHSCGGHLSTREIEADPQKLLFIIDGFDELKLDDSGNMSQEDKTIISLIRQQYLFETYVMITTRPTAMETLMRCLVEEPLRDERFAEILGFSEGDRKEYFTKFFGNEAQAVQAFDSVKENEVLFTMCFVPILCWIVCTVTKDQMENNEDFVSSKTTTSVYMLFLASLIKQQSRDSVQPITNINLRRLCALAKDGIYQQKILFEERDLTEYGIDIPAIQSLFLKEDIFKKKCENYNMYSFIHLSFQEFFAALFYVLAENEAAKKLTQDPQREVMKLLKDYRENNHLMLTVRFLFGLLNEQRLEQMERKFQWKISSDLKPALLRWIKEEIRRGGGKIEEHQLDLIHSLYEIQDEEFVKRATEHWEDIQLTRSSLKRWSTVMDLRALGFCLKNAPGVQEVDFYRIGMKPEVLRALTPGLMKCSHLRLLHCSLTGSCCADLASVLRTNTALTQLDLSYNELGDSGVRELCEGLRHPDCRIQTLRLWSCSLTGSCCADLSSVLSTNTALTQLELSGNELGDSGVRELCEGLRHPDCRIQTLGLYRAGLTDGCTEALCSALQENRSLKELNLENNSFTPRSEASFNTLKETHPALTLRVDFFNSSTCRGGP